MIKATSQGGVILELDGTVIRIPVRFRRRSGRKEILLPPDHSVAKEGANPTDPVALAVARAHLWQRWIEEGRYGSVSALAREERLDEAYVRRILGLTVLSPAIIDALLIGGKPVDVSIRTLLHAPVRWDEQSRRLGIPNREANSG